MRLLSPSKMIMNHSKMSNLTMLISSHMVRKEIDIMERSQKNGTTRDMTDMRDQSLIIKNLSHLKFLTKMMIMNSLELHTIKRLIQLSSGDITVANMEIIMVANMITNMKKTSQSPLKNLKKEVKIKRSIDTRSYSTLLHIFLKRKLKCNARASGATLLLLVPSGVPFFSSFNSASTFIASTSVRRANKFWRNSTWVQKSLLSSQLLDRSQPLPPPLKNQSSSIS